jgi:acyl carrier protein
MTKSEVMDSLIAMITEVLSDGLLDPVEPESSFKDELGFDSIQFVALAELIQDRYPTVNFVTWIQGMDVSQIVALRVGDVADFVVASTPG